MAKTSIQIRLKPATISKVKGRAGFGRVNTSSLIEAMILHCLSNESLTNELIETLKQSPALT